jgi:integrase/recombinase XerD
MTEISPLRRRMIEDMTVRNLSPATQRSYIHAVAKFARFFGRSPESLDLEDVRAFQVHLVAGGMSWPALNQTVCALRFLYGVTLRQADLPERIAYAREPQKLPVVLSAEEVVRFLDAVPSLKCRAALTRRMPPDCERPRSPASRSPTLTVAGWSFASTRARAGAIVT